MEVNQLAALLNSHIDNQNLSFGGSLFPGEGISDLLNALFGQDQLIIEAPQVSIQTDKVLLAGRSGFSTNTTYPIQITLWDDQGDIEARICLKPDPTQLKTILAQLTAKPYPSFLADSDLKILDLILCTQPIPDDESSCPLIKGLNLIGNYVLPASLSNLSDVFADMQNLQIHGTLIQEGDTYRFQWLSPAFTSLTIGSFQADLCLKLIHARHDPGRQGTLYQLIIHLPVFGEFLVLASEPFSENMGLLWFNADLSGKVIDLQSKERLSQLLQSADLSFLPDKFKPAENLILSRFECIMPMRSGMIKSLKVGLTFPRQFDVIPNTLAIKSERLDFIVSGIPTNPQVSASLAATVRIADIELDAHMLFPSTRLEVNLHPEHPIPISRLVDGLIPIANLPAIHIEKIRGELETEAGQYMLECWIESDSKPEFLQYFPEIRSQSTLYLSGNSESASAMIGIDLEVGDTEINLAAKMQKHAEVFGNISYLSLKDAMKHLIGQDLLEIPDIDIRNGYMRLQSDGKFSFSGSLSFDFLKLSKAWNIPIPDTVSNFALNSVSLTSDMLNKNFVLQLSAYPRVPLLQNSDQKIEIVAATFQISESSQIAASLTFHGEAEIAEQVKLICENLIVSYDSLVGKWTADSKATLLIYGQSHELSVSLSNDQISLTYPGEIVFSRLGGNGKLAAQQLSVFAEKYEDGNNKSVRWGLGGDIALVQPGVGGQAWLDVKGHLSLETGAGSRRLRILAEAPQLPNIPLDLGGAFPHSPQLKLRLDDFGFEYTKSDSKNAVWLVRAKAGMQILQIPSLLTKYLPPEELEGYFRTDGKTTILGFDVPSTLQPKFPELALEFSNNKKLSLGQPQLTITKIALSLDKNPQLIVEILVGLPKELNYLFGSDAKGEPNMDLFNESFRLQLTLGKQLSIKLLSSPFKARKFYEKEKKMWSDWNFGDLGEYCFQVPEFNFSKGRWKASAGFERKTDIKLPLKPIKFLLAETGVPQGALTPIPDAIPIKGVDLGNDGFYGWVNDILGAEVLGRIDPNATRILKDFTDFIQRAIERLPDRMQEYFDLRIPESAMLDIAVDSAGGGTKIGFHILDDDPPLKILFPFLGALPEIVGITVRGFSFGQKSGGALAMIEFDGHIDRFDILSLIAALALDQGKSLSNRYILNKILVVIPAGIPLAIPLFFNELGLEYKDVLGSEIQSHWKYPQPEMGIVEYLQLFTALFQFFTKDDYLLHKEGLSDVIPLQLTVGINTIRLPDFLGGGTIGLSTVLPPLNVTDSVTRLLDSLKTGNAGYAIEAIPLKVEDRWLRIGAVDACFGPLEIDAVWCISTQDEFQNIILKNPDVVAMLDKANAGEMLTCLPQQYGDVSYDKGYVILLMGGLKIGSPLGELFHFACQFGMAAMGPGEFETAVRIVIGFGPQGMLELGIEGRIKTDRPPGHPDSTHVHVNGNVYLSVAQQRFELGGNLDIVSGVSFSAGIHLELTKHLLLEGELTVTAGQVQIDGSATFQNIKLGTSAIFDKRGVIFEAVKIDVGALKAKAALQFPGRQGNAFSFWAGVDLPSSFTEDFKKSLIATADAEVTPAINKAYTQFESYAKQVDTFEQSLTGLRGWLPGFCHELIRTINARTTDNAIEAAMWKWAGKNIGRKIAVRTAITIGSPGKTARESAAPWIKKLNAARVASAKPVNQQYKAGLQKALRKLVATNKIIVNVGAGKVKFKAYENKAVLTAEQIALIRKGIEYVGELPEASRQQTHFQQLLDRVPREQLLAQVRDGIDKGLQAIPAVNSIGFEASAGFNASAVNITAAVSYNARDLDISIPVDLTRPDQLPAAISKAFADAYAKS